MAGIVTRTLQPLLLLLQRTSISPISKQASCPWLTKRRTSDVMMDDKQAVKSTKRKAKRLYIAVLICILVCTIGSAGAAVTYQTYSSDYHREVSLAQTAIQHLRTGVTLLEGLRSNPLDALTDQKAQHEFTSASSIFLQLDRDLNALPKISMSIPVYGARLSAASHVLPLAIEVSQVGTIACNTLGLLISRLHDPLKSGQGGLTKADLTVVDQNFQQIKAILNLAIDQVNHLQPADLQLDPRLGKLVATFHKDLPMLQTWLGVAEKLLPVVPTLLGIGTPANYLIEVLDSTELRPGGGFIGNYGTATFSGGRLTAGHITDVNLLDRPFEHAGGRISYPAAYSWFDIAPTWSFRDSNLDADFPTAARYGEYTYKLEGGSVPFLVVFAMIPGLLQHS